MFEIKIKDIAREEVEKSREFELILTGLGIQHGSGDYIHALESLYELESMNDSYNNSAFYAERDMYIHIITRMLVRNMTLEELITEQK